MSSISTKKNVIPYDSIYLEHYMYILFLILPRLMGM
jgi:hypothetical protein